MNIAATDAATTGDANSLQSASKRRQTMPNLVTSNGHTNGIGPVTTTTNPATVEGSTPLLHNGGPALTDEKPNELEEPSGGGDNNNQILKQDMRLDSQDFEDDEDEEHSHSISESENNIENSVSSEAAAVVATTSVVTGAVTAAGVATTTL